VAKSRRGGRTWSSLSPSYRQRLTRHGVDRKAWLAGADLRSTRGHAPAPAAWQAPQEATNKLIHGEAMPADIAQVQAWRENAAPAWLPDQKWDMSDDTAAAVSQIGLPPSQWGHVRFTPRANGEVWTMTVTPAQHMSKDGSVRTHAYDVSVDIPGGGAQGSGAREVLDWLAEYEDIEYEVEGSA
jgi:hypothetical protein